MIKKWHAKETQMQDREEGCEKDPQLRRELGCFGYGSEGDMIHIRKD